MLLGESFSGPIAAAIAAAPPPGLRGLILCATFLRNPRPELGYARFLTGLLPVSLLPGVLLVRMLLGPRADPGLRTQLLDAVSRVEDRVMRARLRAVIDVDAGPRMSGVTLPVLYLSARDDRVVPRRAGTMSWPDPAGATGRDRRAALPAANRAARSGAGHHGLHRTDGPMRGRRSSRNQPAGKAALRVFHSENSTPPRIRPKVTPSDRTAGTLPMKPTRKILPPMNTRTRASAYFR